MHDRLASTVALARALLQGVDPCPQVIDLKVNKAQLKLVLETFIEECGARPSPVRNALPSPTGEARADAARKTVAGHLAAVATEAEIAAFDAQPEGQRRGRF